MSTNQENKPLSHAKLFDSIMKHIWGEAEWEKVENAKWTAENFGGKCEGMIDNPNYRENPGDIPASLWSFTDGSEIIISDDGSMIVER